MALVHVFDYVENRRTGVPMSGVSVSALYKGTTTTAPIYADDAYTPFDPANQVSTDSDGNYSFYIEQGQYSLVYRVGSQVVKTVEDFTPGLSGPSGPANSTYTVTAELKASPISNISAILAEAGKAGTFTIREYADFTAEVAADVGQVNYIRSSVSPDKVWVRTTILPETGAVLMGFKHSIAGAIARTMLAKALETISVKDFGAVGDGATDDRAAINLCLANAPDGATILFPEGTYALTGAVSVPNSKSLTLQGRGDGSKLRRIDVGATGFILDCGAGTDYSTRLVIKDLFFQGAVSGTSNGILLTKCNTARVEGCTFQLQGVGIQSVNSFAIELTSNVFDVMSFYAFIATTACHNAIIKKNNFFTAGSHAVRFDVTSDNLVIDENDFEYCAVGIRLNSCTSVSIKNNYIEYSTGKHIELLGTNRCVEIESNWIALGSGGAAVLNIENIAGGTFKWNRIFNQTVAMQASAVDVELGINYPTGTGSISVQNWQTPALLNSWVQHVNYAPVGFRKDENNNVHLRGNLSGGAAGTVVFNLPAGYRPGSYMTFSALGGGGAVWLEIRPNGDVFTATAPSSLTGLNGVYFKAEG